MARRKKSVSKRKRGLLFFAFLAGLSFLIGGVGFLSYRTKPSRDAFHVPTFESYPSRGTEAVVKRLDRQIYDALQSLGVQAEQVHFGSVETKRSNGDEWTYSNLDVRLKNPQGRSRIRNAFSGRLSSVSPTPSVLFSLGPNNGTVVEISVNGHPTHRLNISSLPKRIPMPSPPPRRPAVAIIIDDMGHDPHMASKFLKLDGQLSFSILPYSPFYKQIATSVHKSGKEVLLHLPMEPTEYPEVDPGQGALISSMTPDELLSQLDSNLEAVPFVVGVNNHMGSRLTEDSSKMRQVFTVLKRRGLFFVDSVTSANSRCKKTAKLLHLKFARRHVFLDHQQDPQTVRFQIKRLISIANRQGKAIGIAHPYPVTWEVLKEDLQRIKSQVNLVPISELVG